MTARKVESINSGVSPIQDSDISRFLSSGKLHLEATLDKDHAYQDAELVIIATPTNYDPNTNYFDTSAVEDVIETVLRVNPNALMVIKSTVPVGYTENVRRNYTPARIIFSPEFLLLSGISARRKSALRQSSSKPYHFWCAGRASHGSGNVCLSAAGRCRG